METLLRSEVRRAEPSLRDDHVLPHVFLYLEVAWSHQLPTQESYSDEYFAFPLLRTYHRSSLHHSVRQVLQSTIPVSFLVQRVLNHVFVAGIMSQSALVAPHLDDVHQVAYSQ